MEGMKERPILFSTPMVQAILDGRKTMTRRIVKPQPPSPQGTFPAKWNFKYWSGRHDLVDGTGMCFSPSKNYGKPSDVLWVRESWVRHNRSKFRQMHTFCSGDLFMKYKADGKDKYDTGEAIKWKPSIHMPKTACRIWLEVVSVKVERLQEITEQDAIAEGMNERYEKDADGLVEYDDRNTEAFECLWNKINGPDSWEANPWVWVVEFKRITPGN